MFSDENKSSSLAGYLNRYDYVILDTCSLMEDGFAPFMDALVNAKTYLKDDRHIVIYHECLQELKKHSKDRSRDTARIAAKRAMKIIRKVKWKRIFEFPKKEKNPNFADNIIYVNVSQRRITQKILVITQDRKLADDLRKLNNLDSQQGRKVSVMKITNEGALDLNLGNKPKHNIHRDYDDFSPFKRERPVFAKAKKVDFDELANKAKLGDDRLWANIHNNNYPFDRKKADIEAQLSLLEKLPEDKKKAIKLRLNEIHLKEELANKPEETKTVEAPKKAVEAPVQEKPIVEAEKPLAKEKPTPVPAEKPKVERTYYGTGSSLEAAITDLGSFSGQIYRDPSIPYFPAIHGKKDLTTLDLKNIAKGLVEKPTSFVYQGVNYWSEKDGRGFRVWSKAVEVTPEAPAPKKKEEEPKKEAPKAVEAPAPKPVVDAPKEAPKKTKAKKVKEDKPETKAEVEEPKKAPKKATKKAPKKEEAPEKVEAAPKAVGTLVVAIPDDQKEREQIERRARRSSEKATTLKAAAKPAKEKKAKTSKSKKKEEAPLKKEEEPKAKAKEAPKKAASKKKAGAKEPKEKTQPKAKSEAKEPKEKAQPKAKAAPQPKVEETPNQDFEIAKKADSRLSCVVNNPNYPKESKINDIKAQKTLLSKLNPEEISKLKYNLAALEDLAAKLQ